ncbi:MAG: sel1 repeat family protein [Roseburia sp.]|nr:sel1 repeat family protein [Roseburia sp.]
MKKKIITSIFISVLAISSLSACGNPSQKSTEAREQAAEMAAEAGTDSKSATEKTEADANDYYEAGYACLYGLNGQKIDYEAALNNFQQALEKGKTEANLYLGLLYDWHIGPEYDYAKAKAYYEAAGDNPYAQSLLGFMYYFGHGVEEDPVKAQELFDEVIAAGCADGYYGSATIAWDEKDYATAFEYLNKAAEGESQIFTSATMYDLGYLYLRGRGVEQNYGKALECYEKAADLGDSSAMDMIGYLYESGEGVEQDYKIALEWYERAANLGNFVSMEHIAYMYENGLGVAKDSVKAKEWYEKAEAAE